MKEQNNEAKVDLSAVKWILRYRFINGAKKEDELKSIIDNIHVGSAEMPSIKLMALMEMKELSFQDVYELVLKKETKKTGDCESYKNLIGLKKIISESIRVGRNSKRVDNFYFEIIKKFENEFNILLNIPYDKLKKIDARIADAIIRVRENKVNLIPGYDGEYGKINIFSESEINRFKKERSSLF